MTVRTSGTAARTTAAGTTSGTASGTTSGTAAGTAGPGESPSRTQLPVTDLSACCTPEGGAALGNEEAERLAAVLKAVAEPTRLRLLSMVAASEGQEACVCDLTEPVGLSQPTVSHHMKVLVDAGLLLREKRGVWAYYRLVPERLQAVAAALTPRA